MKRFAAILLILVVLLSAIHYAAAEDLSSMSTDDLLTLRLQINEELASRYKPSVLPDGITLIDVFPDKQLAIYVRDKVGAFSINDQVTQDDLDRVTDLWINNESYGITSLEGIQYLRNLKRATVISQRDLTSLPDCFDEMPNLYQLKVSQCAITKLPPSICSSAIEDLDVYGNPITALPDDIGNMTALKKLNISHTKITELPASIRNLKLEEFNRSGLNLGD